MNDLPKTKAEAVDSGSSYYFTGRECKQGHVSKIKTSNSGCWECKKLSDAKRRQMTTHKAKAREWSAKRRKDPVKRLKDRQAENAARKTPEYREKIKAYNNEYKKNNRDKANHYRARRGAAKLSRTPAWLSDEDMRKIQHTYTEARQLTKETGIVHHVDHVIPLNGFLVSGLHVPINLQILTAQDNLIKSNTYRS